MSRFVPRVVVAESRPFARHHAIRLPVAGMELTLDDDERGSGAYGRVLPVLAVDGRPPTPAIVAKVMNPRVVALAHGPDAFARRVASLHAALARCQDQEWPDALLALPFSALDGEPDGQGRLVLLMLDLAPLGYEEAPFGDVPDDVHRCFRGRPPADRVELAGCFAERMALLEELPFVHGDLNPPNLLLNFGTLDVQVIDFDTGAVLATGDERPLAPGKPGDCMPPEINIPGEPDPDVERYTPGAERWSIASLIGFLLTGFHPGFFLSRYSAETVAAYAAAHRWPDVDMRGPLFHTHEQAPLVYRAVRPELEALPPRVQELFVAFFSAGTDGERRPSARAWADAFAALRVPPTLAYVVVDERLVVQGEAVTVEWEALDADRVESPELGTLPPVGSTTVHVEHSTCFTLTAHNRYGTSAPLSSEVVRVIPLPRIETVPIPPPPRLELHANVALHALPRIAPPQFELPRLPAMPVLSPLQPRLPDGRARAPPLPPLPNLSGLMRRLFPPVDLHRREPFR